MANNANGLNGPPWKKINIIIGIVVSLFALVGGVVGSQKYLEEKYAENEDIDHVMEMVANDNEEVIHLVSMNAKSIQLNQYRLEQKIIEDRVDRKRDLKDEVELKEPSTPKEYRSQQQQIRNLNQDIRELERDLEKIDKP